MNHRRTYLILGTLLMLAAIGFGHSVEAISISPPTFELSMSAGQTMQQKIRVTNDESNPVTLYTSTANFKAQGETGQPDFLFDVQTSDLASWLKSELESVTLQPGDSQLVSFTVNVPANAEPGGHYAGLFFGSGAPQTDSGQIGVQSKLGSLIILSVDGNIHESANISEFSVEKGKNKNRLPLQFTVRIENLGNVHFRPSGFITIRNMFGGVAASLPVNPKEGAVLPASTRRFDVTWQRNPPGNGKGFFSEIGQELKNFALGSYTAEAVMTYGKEDKTITAATKFSVFPWRILSLFLLMLIVVIVLLVLAIKSYNRMIIRRAERTIGKTPPPTGSQR